MILHKSWLPRLNPILATTYMRKMMVFLHEIYKVKYVTPAKEDLFKPFKITDFDELSVVIIADKPYDNLRYTNGLALASNPEEVDIKPELVKVAECIEETVYKGFKLDFDYSLESWAQQGVLLLNANMTHIENYSEVDPTDLWRDFIRQVVKSINDAHTGIHFLFLGEEAQYFKQHVDEEFQWIYEYELPSVAVRSRTQWACPHFKTINERIEENQGPEFCIEW
jgi:uracil-DNA glycosylase